MQGYRQREQAQRGNILFLILLAVVLFAALSYAVTSSMRGGGNDASRESAKAEAATITQYGTLIEQTISRLRLSQNCSLAQLSFQNDVVTGYDNTATPSDNRCKIFHPSGGGVTWQNPPQSEGPEPYLFTIQNLVVNVGNSDVGGAGNDLIMVLPIKTLVVCQQINTMLGIADLATDWSHPVKYTGETPGTSPNIIPDDGGNLAAYYGKPEGCVQTYSSGGGFWPDPVTYPYMYYRVVWAR